MNPCPLAVRTLSALLAVSAIAVPAQAQRVETLSDIGPGSSSGDPFGFTEMNGSLYFLAAVADYRLTGGAGFDLWRTDGTPAGTVNVSQIPAQPAGPPGPVNTEVARVGNTIYFTAWNYSAGTEIWTSDGLTASMLTDLCPGPCGAPQKLTAQDGFLYFVETEGAPGAELYRTDGTVAGTVLVADVNPGPDGSSPSFLASFRGHLFFAASDGLTTRLWRTDGTAAGTLPVVLEGPAPSNPRDLTVVGDQLFFVADDNGAADGELWVTDGTPAGTRMVLDIRPGLSSNPQDLIAFDGRLYFSADDGTFGAELWQSDGTAPGTMRVIDINAGPGSASPQRFAVSGGALYFNADDGVTGRELWKAVAQAAPLPAIHPVADIVPGPGSSNPRDLADVDGTLFFTADGPEGTEMWRSFGWPGTTQLVFDVQPGPGSSNPARFRAVPSGSVVFSATTDTQGNEPRVLHNRRPAAAAGADVTILPGENAALDATASTDEDGDPLFYEWRDGAGVVFAFGPAITVTPQVTTTYRLTVLDGFGGRATDTVTVTVDGTPNVVLDLFVYGEQGGEGTVAVHPPDAVCSNVNVGSQYCSYEYPQGTTVTLTASPAPGSLFVRWEGSCSGTGACQVALDQSRFVQAVFRGPQWLNLTVHGFEGGYGTVRVAPPEQFCANAPNSQQTCSYSFPADTLVTLQATPAPGSAFMGWFGDGCSGTQPTCVLPMSQTAWVDATFRGPQRLSVNVHGFLQNGSGSVHFSPPETDCVVYPGGIEYCESFYVPGTTVTLTATSAPDSVFMGWVGECNGLQPTCTVTMDQARHVDAWFRGPQPLVTIVQSFQNGVGMVHASPPDQYCTNGPGTEQACETFHRVGTTVTLTATPAPDSVFMGWLGACNGVQPVCEVTVTDPTSATAVFRGPQSLVTIVQSFQNGVGMVHASPPNQYCANGPGTEQACETFHRVGTTVTLTATSAPDSVFMGWLGACNGVQPVCEVTVTDPTSATAVFRGPQSLVTIVQSFQNGVGMVHASPPNQYCTNGPGTEQACETFHRVGTTVTLTATASPDSVFMGWLGACNGVQPVCEVTVVDPVSATAVFRGPQSLVTIVQSYQNGVGMVHASPPNQYCTNGPGTEQACETFHRVGTTVTLTATSAPDSVFMGWLGACNGVQPVCEVTVVDPTSATAVFRGPQSLVTIVQSDQNGVGMVHMSPPNQYCANGPGTEQSCETFHRAGTTVTLTATASPDSVFMGWIGACSGAQPVCEVTVVDPTSATAVFRGPQSLALTLTGSEGAAGRVDVSPSGAFCELAGQPEMTCESFHRPGDMVTLTATAADGSVFVGFTGCVGTNVCTLTMVEARSVTAAFRVNHPPVASAGGPYTALRNVAITFDGSGSSDADGDALTYAWDFGDGATGTGASPTHAYAAVGTYTVTLVVHDGRVASAPATATVTITNARPVAAIAGGNRTGYRGEALAFDGSGSTDGDGDGLTYAWDFGDGATATGASASHAWSSLGTFTVTLVVHDGIESSAPATVTVTIQNRAPVANAGGPYSGVRGTAVAFNGTASSDPDGDPLTYAWDFGDGATGTGANPTHAYAALGSFTVTLVVSDGLTSSAPAQAMVTIANRAPVANPGGPYSGSRVAAIAFNGSGSSDPDSDPLTFAWNFGDGATGTGSTPTHLYTTLGTFTVTLVVSDGFTSSAPVTTTVTIANLGPVANAGLDRTVQRRAVVTLDGRASSDPDGTIAAYSWRQLSGTTVTLANANTSQPTFTAPNTTTTIFLDFEVRVTDNNGASAIDVVRITVIK